MREFFLFHCLVFVEEIAESECPSRFLSLSDEAKQKLFEDATTASTRAATRHWLTVLNDFVVEMGMQCDLEKISEKDLAGILENFYCSLKRKNGQEYKRSSYLAARGAVQRELNRLDRGINIQSPVFSRANKLLDATLKEKKRDGREMAVNHKDGLSEEDWKKVNAYFSDVSTTLDIKKVTYYIWFQCTLHFCLRGSEAQSQLKPSNLQFTTVAGERAIVLHCDFQSKNHQGGLRGTSSDTKVLSPSQRRSQYLSDSCRN